MRKKDIKARELILLRTAIKLFGLLCFFFSFTVSAQIFQINNTEIFIGDETVVTQNFSQIQKPDSVHIYITAGTTVTGLHSDQNIAVIYLEKPEETKTHLAEKHSEQEKKVAEHTPSEKKVAEHTPSEKKAIHQKETFKQNDSQKTFLFSAHHSSAAAPTTSQNIKLLAFFPKEAKNNITTNATSKKLIFENINLVLLSVCLTANSIRPPPFV